MKAEIVYKGKKREEVHSVTAYPCLYLCIIANPSRKEEVRYLRAVELRKKPVPSIITRMFKEMPFGFMSQREAVFLPKDERFQQAIHPLLLEPFPDELAISNDTVYMRRRMGEKEFFYECTLKETEEFSFPVISEYAREVDGEKEVFTFKDVWPEGKAESRG